LKNQLSVISHKTYCARNIGPKGLITGTLHSVAPLLLMALINIGNQCNNLIFILALIYIRFEGTQTRMKSFMYSDLPN
jgi:hypothetical protein